MADDERKEIFGLKQETVEKINSVFSSHERVEKVIVYGSRAKGNYKNGSDIDFVMIGESVGLTELLKIGNELDDLLLPYKIDLSLMHKIENPDLIDHINRGALFFMRLNQRIDNKTKKFLKGSGETLFKKFPQLFNASF